MLFKMQHFIKYDEFQSMFYRITGGKIPAESSYLKFKHDIMNKLLQPGIQTVWFPKKMPYGKHNIAVFALASLSFLVLVFVIFLSRV